MLISFSEQSEKRLVFAKFYKPSFLGKAYEPSQAFWAKIWVFIQIGLTFFWKFLQLHSLVNVLCASVLSPRLLTKISWKEVPNLIPSLLRLLLKSAVLKKSKPLWNLGLPSPAWWQLLKRLKMSSLKNLQIVQFVYQVPQADPVSPLSWALVPLRNLKDKLSI